MVDLLSVDLRADDRNCLLIDAGCIPALQRTVVGLARLVAAPRPPAVTAQEVGRRGQAHRPWSGCEVGPDRCRRRRPQYSEHTGRQELRLADLAVPSAPMSCRAQACRSARVAAPRRGGW